MKKNNLLLATGTILSFAICEPIHAVYKWGETETKTYENEDGTSYTATFQFRNEGSNGGDAYFRVTDSEGNSVYSHYDMNIVSYNEENEVIRQSFYYAGRITYVADEDNNIIAVKTCWSCPIVDNFKYTDNDKLLVYGNDGVLKGVYDSLLDYQVAVPFGTNNWNGEPTNIVQKYLDHSLNLTEEDGSYTAKDEDDKVLGIYYQNGDYVKNTYNKNGNLLSSNKYNKNGDILQSSINKYDAAGNLVQQYKNGKLTYAKTIYTPAEAAAATKPDGNTVSITW